jgi:hypothetical protein
MPHVSLSVPASLLYSVIAFHKGSPVGLYYPQIWRDVKRLVGARHTALNGQDFASPSKQGYLKTGKIFI